MKKPKTELDPITREIFEKAANEAGTDKAAGHGYHRFYPTFLSQLDRKKKFAIIEIGYGNGASIAMWKSLFPNAHLLLIDRDVTEIGDGYSVAQADQSDPISILEAAKTLTLPVELIIDDGSHYPQHQLTSLSALMEGVLQPGGLYFIEDIETSYWVAGNLYGNEIRSGLFCKWSAIETLKLAADYANRKFLCPEDRNLVEYSMMMSGLSPSAAGMIETLSFGHNCIAIRKAEEHDAAYSDQEYTYEPYVKRNWQE